MKKSLRFVLAAAVLASFAPIAMASSVNPGPEPKTGIVESASQFSAPINPGPEPKTGVVLSAAHFSAPINPGPEPKTGIVLLQLGS